MVYDIVLTTLYSVVTVILDPRLQLDAGFAAGVIVRIAWELNQLHLHGSTGQVNPSFLILRQFAYNFVQGWNGLNCQWPFQEPQAEVPTICKAYVRAKFQGISPQNMAKNMVQYLDLRLLKMPLKLGVISLIFIFFPWWQLDSTLRPDAVHRRVWFSTTGRDWEKFHGGSALVITIGFPCWWMVAMTSGSKLPQISPMLYVLYIYIYICIYNHNIYIYGVYIYTRNIYIYDFNHILISSLVLVDIDLHFFIYPPKKTAMNMCRHMTPLSRHGIRDASTVELAMEHRPRYEGVPLGLCFPEGENAGEWKTVEEVHSQKVQSQHVKVCVCVYINIYTYVFISDMYICICMCMCICICICIRIYVYVYTYTYIYIYIISI